MRRTLLAFSFCLGSLCCIAQTAPVEKPKIAPTSQEEYNYATKGLKTQRAQGLDLKAGYTLQNDTELPIGTTTVKIEDLVRKQDNSLACVIAQVSSSKMAEPTYLAIPNASTGGDIFKQYAKSVNDLDPTVAKMVLYTISGRLGGMTSIVYKVVK
ncbi:hypothetical protein BXP70_25750 [Hymenobacter crusticola]|uniref:CHRD domain-containing protein n=2 Tax=Hymenobacter crusticola TaxID=1770526 RepID=A0A243W8V0_9BACT|nr:hypothetical protein BXP70_25750 [Hymenobacter crusticola]